MNFKDLYDNYICEINAALESILADGSIPANLGASMRYSVMAGGKRLRPVLALSVSDMLFGNRDDAMRIACGIEMIHTYSLIHDDLPAMDNDDLRRGRPTNHKVYGEAMAILAGDALLTYAVHVMLGCGPGCLPAVRHVVRCAGAAGMVGGQCADMALDMADLPDTDRLEYIHRHKTCDMIEAAVLGGAMTATKDDQVLQALKTYANCLGMAFQIRDDCLDVTSTAQEFGKTPGKDAQDGKLTYVTLYGLDAALKKTAELTNAAMDALAPYLPGSEFLIEVARSSRSRRN